VNPTLTGKVALVTGAGRGQGRSHALRLAEAGADIVAVDICEDLPSVAYPLSSPDDLQETVTGITELGRTAVGFQADVRDASAMRDVVAKAVAQLGHIDFVIANAGISAMRRQESPHAWDEVIGVNLTGVFNTVQAASGPMIERDEGGAVVLTGSIAALTAGYGGTPSGLAYTAAKHGVVGLMRSYAAHLGRYGIRVNAIHPSAVDTAMAQSEEVHGYTEAIRQGAGRLVGSNALRGFSIADPVDISNAVLFLVSDAARYITGVNLAVDAGFSI
jgi:SDR family mycofactocin-dependent oxidoreductase